MTRALLVTALAALIACGAAAARPALLPSPTTPLDDRVPVTANAAPSPVQLPLNARIDNAQEVLVDVTPDGEVVRVRVRQRLTLRGLGDFFFQIPAPVRDVRALPDSQTEPGLRRNAILWQGFSPRRRLLAAEVELDPKAAARALPLRLDRRGDGIRLRNATATRALGFVAAARRASVLAAARRIAAQAARSRPVDQPTVEIEGATTGRRLLVDAPLRITGVAGAHRFGRILGGLGPAETTIAVPANGDVELVAEPVPLLPQVQPRPDATGGEILLLAERMLFRLARVHQYRTFLGSPAVPGDAKTVYRYRTVAASAPTTPVDGDEDGLSGPLVALLAAIGLLGLGGAVVLWAHL